MAWFKEIFKTINNNYNYNYELDIRKTFNKVIINEDILFGNK